MKKKNCAVTMVITMSLSMIMTGCGKEASVLVNKAEPAVTATLVATQTQKPVNNAIDSPKIIVTRVAKTFQAKDGKAETCYVNMERASVDKSVYPELAKGLEQWFDDEEKVMEQRGKDVTQEEEQTKQENDNVDEKLCGIQQHISQKRADEKVLSMEVNQYEFHGGTHGQTTIIGLTFDTKTGKELRQSDIIMNQNQFERIASEFLITEAEKMLGEAIFPEYKETIREQMPHLSWMLTDYGMQVVFQEYDIAPYAAGPIRIEIPYKLIKDTLAIQYLPDGI